MCARGGSRASPARRSARRPLHGAPAPGRPCSGKSSDLEPDVSEPVSALSHSLCDLEKVNSPGAFVPCTAAGKVTLTAAECWRAEGQVWQWVAPGGIA